MLVYHGGTSAWRLHTELCKFLYNISTKIWTLGKRTDLKFGEVSFFISITSQFPVFIRWMVYNLFFAWRWKWSINIYLFQKSFLFWAQKFYFCSTRKALSTFCLILHLQSHRLADFSATRRNPSVLWRRGRKRCFVTTKLVIFISENNFTFILLQNLKLFPPPRWLQISSWPTFWAICKLPNDKPLSKILW